MKFRIEDLEKYKKELEKTGRKALEFENVFMFLKLGIFGYVLLTIKRGEIQELAQSKDWEEFKNQVWEALCGKYL